MTIWTAGPPAKPQAPTTATRAADGRVLAWTAVAAILTDLSIRSGLIGLAGALTLATVAVATFVSGRIRRPQPVAMALGAVTFAGFLVLRSSPWLVLPDAGASVLLIMAAASLEGGGDLFDLDLHAWFWRAWAAASHVFRAPAFLARGLLGTTPIVAVRRDRADRLAPIARGLAAAVPVVVLLSALLASADPIFASYFHLPNPQNLAAHLILFGFGAWATGSVFRTASAPVPVVPDLRRRLGITEGIVVLLAVDVVFAVFVGTQLIAAAGAADHVLRGRGLTYAQYARSGYFQLLWASALSLAVLISLEMMVSRPTRSMRRWFGVGMCGAELLTLGIVVVALHRLALYEHVFGLTMLRLSAHLFAVWIAAMFALLFASSARLFRHRRWFAGAALGAGLALLLAFNVANPEALVVRRDVATPTWTDPTYLARLSDDALPSISARLALLPPGDGAAVVSSICARHSRWHGWGAFSLSKRHADRVRHQICSPSTRSG